MFEDFLDILFCSIETNLSIFRLVAMNVQGQNRFKFPLGVIQSRKMFPGFRHKNEFLKNFNLARKLGIEALLANEK